MQHMILLDCPNYFMKIIVFIKRISRAIKLLFVRCFLFLDHSYFPTARFSSATDDVQQWIPTTAAEFFAKILIFVCLILL